MNRAQDDESRQWHVRDRGAVLSALDATDQGLGEAEAAARLERYGRNRLPEQPPVPVWRIALRQFASPLIYVLLAAAGVSLAVGEVKDAIFIAVVLVINAIIGTYQEWKAERSSQALRRLLQIRAAVQRDGQVRDIAAELVVPGDLVLLESGNRIPADLRLLMTAGLEVDESLLTGESVAVAKDPAWHGTAEAPLGDRANMVYAGSMVTRGRGRGVAVATGTATHIGQLAVEVVATTGGKPPLVMRMERFSTVIAVATLVIATLIGVIGLAVGGYELAQMFLFITALAVSAIPEGLPIALTVALSIATSRMARRGVVVRQLTAVEGLGSCTLIATDKTGTLTANELTVREVRLPTGHTMQVTGEGFAPHGEVFDGERPIGPGDNQALEALVLAGVLCNEADLVEHEGGWQWRGDAVDIALLSLGRKFGKKRADAGEEHPQTGTIPFEPSGNSPPRSTAAALRRGCSSRARPSGSWRCAVAAQT